MSMHMPAYTGAGAALLLGRTKYSLVEALSYLSVAGTGLPSKQALLAGLLQVSHSITLSLYHSVLMLCCVVLFHVEWCIR